MKVLGIASSATLSLLLGISTSVYSQQDQKGDRQDHSKQQEAGRGQAQPAQQQRQPQQQRQQQRQEQPQQQRQQQQERQPQETQQPQRQTQDRQQQLRGQQQHQPDRAPRQPERAQQGRDQNRQQQAHGQQQRSNQGPMRTQQQQRVQQGAWQQHRAGNWQSDHRTWQQRGGYNGYHIPDDRYRGYFGSSHGFRISGLPFLVVGGYPRFQYGGYWFSPVDPWPEYWANNWYDTDDVYVSYYDNGYYLYNRRYPTVGIAINVSM